ncbi:MAG: ABC transporter substrate-binding protein [Oligoflexia bacterium]|nr:ABC transporter substrate-binding protein [Oligoflexia bacterium]
MKAVCALICVLVFARDCAYGENAPIRVGYITDLSGPGAFFGVPGLRGVQLAIAELKSAGHNIEVLVEDSKSNPADSVTAAIRLIEEGQVDAVVCDLTQVCTAVSPKVAAAHRPLIYHSPSLAIEKSNPDSYRNFLDYEDACGALAKELLGQGVKRIGSLAANVEFGELCWKGVEREVPAHYSYRYNPADDLRSAVMEFKRRGIEAVVLVGFEPDVVSWFKYSQALQYKPRQAFIEVLLNDTIRNAAGDLLSRALVAGFNELPNNFESTLNAQVGGPQNKNIQSSAITYNAIMAFGHSMSSCPARESSCLAQALRSKQTGLMGFSGFQRGKSPYPTRVKAVPYPAPQH